MKIYKIVFLVCCSLLLLVIVNQYFFCPRFKFAVATPFEGPVIYNPYASINAENWAKCNFHAHATAWNGITNGHGSAADVHQAYDSLGYHVHCVSNYHQIDTVRAGVACYIPAYEHGYNINKTHHLVLGSHKVLWLDYLFPQTTHNKQNVLSRLHNKNAVVILNHPALRKGYTVEDMKNLGDYDCMEVLNPSVVSAKEWDAALSAGKKVFIVGNDDLHDVISRKRLGEMCTFVNVGECSQPQVLNALKTGKSYGVIFGKKQDMDQVPQLDTLSVIKDSIVIQMSHPAEQITITGQNGKLLASFSHTTKAVYRLKAEDRYARAVITYDNGTRIFLNPVFFMPKSGYKAAMVTVDRPATILFTMLGMLIILLWLMVLLWIAMDNSVYMMLMLHNGIF